MLKYLEEICQITHSASVTISMCDYNNLKQERNIIKINLQLGLMLSAWLNPIRVN